MATLLCIEDDRSLANLLRFALEREGFTVQIAHTGQEGLRLMRAAPPDLIVLDVSLPDMSGHAVLAAVRAFSQAPILVLTGRTADDDIALAIAHGAAGFISKPFSPPLLIARIQAMVHGTPQPRPAMPRPRAHR